MDYHVFHNIKVSLIFLFSLCRGLIISLEILLINTQNLCKSAPLSYFLWTTWSSEECHYLFPAGLEFDHRIYGLEGTHHQAQLQEIMLFNVPSNPYHSVIPWFYDFHSLPTMMLQKYIIFTNMLTLEVSEQTLEFSFISLMVLDLAWRVESIMHSMGLLRMHVFFSIRCV